MSNITLQLTGMSGIPRWTRTPLALLFCIAPPNQAEEFTTVQKKYYTKLSGSRNVHRSQFLLLCLQLQDGAVLLKGSSSCAAAFQASLL